MAWSKSEHEGDILGWDCGQGHLEDDEFMQCCVLTRASQVVRSMLGAEWEMVADVLEVLKFATENQANGRWEWDQLPAGEDG